MSDGDLGQDVGDVGGRDRLYEQGSDRRAAVPLRPGRRHLGEVVEVRTRDDAPRHRASLDELLLRPLAGAVGVAGEPREADDRQQHVVLHSRLLLGLEQVAGRTAEERDCLVVVGRCATARVDDGIDARECRHQSFTGVHVDALGPADRDGLVARALQRLDGEATDASGCSDDCDSHALCRRGYIRS